MRVQVSQESKILLETTGGYKIQEKGIIKLPGQQLLWNFNIKTHKIYFYDA